VFKFRLQRVLELREQKEQQVATALAEARDRADAARADAHRLAAVRAAGGEQLAGAPSVGRSVGELRQLAFVLDQLDLRIATAEGVVAQRDADVVRHQADLNAAFQDRRVLDRLREKHLDAWKVGEVQLDRQTMDEIALARFGKRER
jgi:flagellar FliJ protein